MHPFLRPPIIRHSCRRKFLTTNCTPASRQAEIYTDPAYWDHLWSSVQSVAKKEAKKETVKTVSFYQNKNCYESAGRLRQSFGDGAQAGLWPGADIKQGISKYSLQIIIIII